MSVIYAVKKGKKIGIYNDWSECEKQVKGFSGADFRKFKNRKDAEAYLSDSLNGNEKQKRYYAVKIGRKPGIYDNWEDCKIQVYRCPGAYYKKCKTYEQAVMFMSKKQQPSQFLSDTKPYAFVDGSFNVNTKVYGYGGFLCANGKKYIIYGFGSDPNMIGMRNVAGEIEGAMAAVRKAEQLKLKTLIILYDYKGIEEWAKPSGEGWKIKGPAIKNYADFMRDPERLTQISFQKVAAHTGIKGNEIADIIAKNAVGISLTSAQRLLLIECLK